MKLRVEMAGKEVLSFLGVDDVDWITTFFCVVGVFGGFVFFVAGVDCGVTGVLRTGGNRERERVEENKGEAFRVS